MLGAENEGNALRRIQRELGYRRFEIAIKLFNVRLPQLNGKLKRLP